MRPISFEEACRRYVHRFTMEHVPAWATLPRPVLQTKDKRYYAPQFRSDREWYDATRFKGEEGWFGRGNDCYTTGQTWPLGQGLDAPYQKVRA